jgi:hypothetical protein
MTSSEEPVQEQQAVAEKPWPELYKIQSLVREISTRNQRMKAAVHHRFVQRFGGGTITVRRTRPATVTKAALLTYLEEIKKAVSDGKVQVTTLTGGIVNLDTFEVTPVVQPSSPLPNPPPDSAANDKTYVGGVGEHKPLFGGEGGVPGGEAPPLTIKDGLMSNDTPIQTSGDPAKARAAGLGGDEDELDSDEEDTKPDVLEPTHDGETAPGSKRGRDKKSKKESGK